MRIEVQPLVGFNRLLTYGVGDNLSKDIKVGCLIEVPLGRRRVLAIVFSLASDELIAENKLRFVSSLVQPEPVLSPDLVRLSNWIQSYYSCTMEAVLAAMIPAVVREGKRAKKKNGWN